MDKSTTKPCIEPKMCELKCASNGLNRRKLVLHFDIRNTILVADSVTKIGVEESLNSYLTGVTWGHGTKNGEWVWDQDVPTLTAPKNNKIGRKNDKNQQIENTFQVTKPSTSNNNTNVNENLHCDITMTYYKFIERRLVKDAHDRVALRQKTGNFTQEKIGKCKTVEMMGPIVKKLLYSYA